VFAGLSLTDETSSGCSARAYAGARRGRGTDAFPRSRMSSVAVRAGRGAGSGRFGHLRPTAARRCRRRPGAAEAFDPLAVCLALGVIAGVPVQRHAAERDLKNAVAAAHERQPSLDAGPGLQLGVSRGNRERWPEFQARAALALEMARRLTAQGVEGPPLG